MNLQNPKLSKPVIGASMTLGAVVLFFGLVLITRLLRDGLVPVASAVGAILLFLSLILFRRTFTPYRWMALSLVFVTLFTVYPFVSTLLISTTNMSGGHLLTRQQAIDRLESKTYAPEGAETYGWTIYRRGDHSWRVLLESEDGAYLLGEDGKQVETVDRGLGGLGDLEADGLPLQIDGHRKLARNEALAIIDTLGALVFFKGDHQIRITSLRQAQELVPLYQYDAEGDVILDMRSGVRYAPVEGTFTAADGETLVPGYKVNIGLRNYARFVANPGYRRPIARIILWNIAFSFFSVLISFGIGLLIAMAFENLPGRRIIRTLLIIPYPIPVLVSITVWKGLLNESMGLVTKLIEGIGLVPPAFFTDKTWARIALILINVYLSYPYFYILASGALRSIPENIYEAAEIDGASILQKLGRITMPMIMRILMPLLIASFSFNFNNFTLIWGYNAGLPAMADSIVPMGHTDLLVSFVYRLGFSTANATNYGFAAAITVLLFIFVALMVITQLRTTRALKED